jgi:hypothetical protein
MAMEGENNSWQGALTQGCNYAFGHHHDEYYRMAAVENFPILRRFWACSRSSSLFLLRKHLGTHIRENGFTSLIS